MRDGPTILFWLGVFSPVVRKMKLEKELASEFWRVTWEDVQSSNLEKNLRSTGSKVTLSLVRTPPLLVSRSDCLFFVHFIFFQVLLDSALGPLPSCIALYTHPLGAMHTPPLQGRPVGPLWVAKQVWDVAEAHRPKPKHPKAGITSQELRKK